MAKAPRSEFFLVSNKQIVWEHLLDPVTEDIDGQKMEKPTYEATLLFPKLSPSPAHCQNYMMLWGKLCETFMQAFPGVDPSQMKNNPIKDGDTARTQAGELRTVKNLWLAGHWYIKVSSKRPLGRMVGPDNEPLNTIGGVKPIAGGDWCDLSINVWSYGLEPNAKNRGVNFGIEALRRLRNGDVVIGDTGGGPARSADEIFGAAVGPALQPAAAYGQPQYGAPPAPGGYGAPQAPQYGAPPAPGAAPQYATPAAYGAPAMPPLGGR